VSKLDRLARSLPDARAIADHLTRRHLELYLGGSMHDPTDPVGRLLFNVLASGRRIRSRSSYARARASA
jgi:DNA invertase Pin-like site-specific DNA recombinase